MFEDLKEKGKERFTGKVKWFSDEKGFGFIQGESETANDIFFHFSSIIEMPGFKSLGEGDQVEFEIEKTDRGKVARNIQLIKEARGNDDF